VALGDGEYGDQVSAEGSAVSGGSGDEPGVVCTAADEAESVGDSVDGGGSCAGAC